MSEKTKEVEYPRWVYPPDGGPGKIAQTPDDKPKGWCDEPTTPGPASGERVMGQPSFPISPTPPLDQTAGARPPQPHAPPPEDDEDDKKSKKK